MTIGNTITETAYHEAGHIVVASATGLPLRPSGIIVYEVAENVADGYAVYGEDGPLKEPVLMALLAGTLAQVRKFPKSWIGGSHSDELKFRELIKLQFEDRWREMSEELVPKVKQLLDDSWSALTEIVESLLESPWIPVQSSEHPKARRKKQLNGSALAEILQRHDIPAKVCAKS